MILAQTTPGGTATPPLSSTWTLLLTVNCGAGTLPRVLGRPRANPVEECGQWWSSGWNTLAGVEVCSQVWVVYSPGVGYVEVRGVCVELGIIRLIHKCV